MLKKAMIKFFTFVAFMYVYIFVLAYFFADKLMFHPPKPHFEMTSEHRQLETVDGDFVTLLHLKNKQAKHTLLFAHGNAEDIGELRWLFDNFREQGFNLLAVSYPGYAYSSGKPTEKNAYSAITAAYQYLTEQQGVAPENIIVHGRSIGGGPAVELAMKNPIGGLIIESTFVSAIRTVTLARILPFDYFENLKKISKVTVPLLVIHGDRDRTVAFWHGQKLFKEANAPKEGFWVKGAGHNNLQAVAGESYYKAIMSFSNKLSGNEPFKSLRQETPLLP